MFPIINKPAIKPDFLAILSISIFAVLLLLNAPTAGDFYWSDAPRHALNGIFLKDLIHDFPWQDPSTYAINYYLQYPALTILFYPPLFYGFLAVFYTLFGESHFTAQLLVSFFHLAMGLGLFYLARRWLSTGFALAAALFWMGAHEIVFWGRQIMLDIPAMAWLIWSVLFFLRYLDHDRPRHLILSAMLLLAAIYTKQTMVFALIPLLIALLRFRGFGIIKKPVVWKTAILFIILLIPLIIITLKFGQKNLSSTVGERPWDASLFSLEAWIYYFRQLPHQLGKIHLWPIIGGIL
ncbi:ArnT family glycosyltransferase, partial [Magnetococcales bacterium HHB-1]